VFFLNVFLNVCLTGTCRVNYTCISQSTCALSSFSDGENSIDDSSLLLPSTQVTIGRTASKGSARTAEPLSLVRKQRLHSASRPQKNKCQPSTPSPWSSEVEYVASIQALKREELEERSRGSWTIKDRSGTINGSAFKNTKT
jgi:hypothetical protein